MVGLGENIFFVNKNGDCLESNHPDGLLIKPPAALLFSD